MNENRKTGLWRGQAARFLAAQTVSLLGSSLVQYAIIWYITLSTSSGAMLTLSTLCGFAPQVLISLYAGVLVDRYDRKKMIMLADGMIAAATLALAVLFLIGQKSVWLMFGALAVRSAGTGLQTPALSAFLPQIVPAEKLMKVNGINGTVSALLSVLSPALSGALLSAAGMEAAFLLDVGTAVLGISITAGIHASARERRKQGSGFSGIAQGFAYLKENTLVRRMLIFQAIVLFLISPSAFLTPLLVSRTFGAEVWRLTMSEMGFSLGAVLGGVLIALWGGFQSRMRTVFFAGAMYGGFMMAVGAAGGFAVYLAFNLLIGVVMPCYNTPLTVLLQEQVPAEMQGRVFSFMQISTGCALPLGMLLFGPMADRLSVQTLLLGAGGLAILATLLFLLRTRRGERA